MIDLLLAKARSDEPVFISEVASAFSQLPGKSRLTLLLEKIDGSTKVFELDLPGESDLPVDQAKFVKEYILARVYNILSSLGGRSLTLDFDENLVWLSGLISELDTQFGIHLPRKERTGYGKCINVLDRMLEHLEVPGQKAAPFRFLKAHAKNDLPLTSAHPGKEDRDALSRFIEAASDLDGKALLGIDVGGTDIKVAASVDGEIRCFKEYDWFPANFKVANEMIDPILLLVRLVQAQISLPTLSPATDRQSLERELAVAMDRTCPLDRMEDIVLRSQSVIGENRIPFDAIGLCFPDVVIADKIVGGEVYKTRGMRENPEIDYEEEFAKLTDLDQRLLAFCKPEGQVRMTNDGPMASYTAAVEQAFSSQADRIADGVFAHTLGTELGTGWIDETGSIPDIPLEVYNFVIDLGSYNARRFHCDDLRSVNNFNTGLAGTLQKYASQSGAFRLAIRYFEAGRPDLYKEMVDKGFIETRVRDGVVERLVPTEPVDQRKPFLQYLMDLVHRERDPLCDQIFVDIGEYLAVTWLESEWILEPKAKSRVLFGRLVKNPRCFELMQQGARRVVPDLSFEIADGSIANTRLMKQLEADPHYTVAQFAQAIGAIYFGNAR